MERSRRFNDVVESSRESTRGAAFLPVLVLTLLLLGCTLASYGTVKSLLDSGSQELHAAVALANAETRLSEALATTSSSADRSVQSAALSRNLELIVASGTAGFASRGRGVLRARANPAFPRLNWSVLLRSPVAAGSCKRWERETASSVTQTKSARRCTRTDSPLTEDLVIAGNLELDSALSLSGVGPGRVRLATLGEIHLSELDLSRLRNVAVEVVAGGDLTVDSLLTTDAAEVELLFHSARGAIRIGGLGADASWCIPGHAPTQVRIRFEAEAGADVGGVAVPAGCGFTRDERVWPVRQVLGELVM